MRSKNYIKKKLKYIDLKDNKVLYPTFEELWTTVLNTHSQSMLIYGMSYSGKTFQLEQMLKLPYYNKFKKIYYITGQVSKDVKKIERARPKQVKIIYPLNKKTEQFIENEIKKRNYILDKLIKQNLENKYTLTDVLFIFDDFVNAEDKKSLKKLFKYLVTASRHINISVIMLSQNIVADITPDIRSNIDIVIFTMIDDTREELIWKTYFRFMTRRDFAQLVKSMPKYSKLVKVLTIGAAFKIE
jgi:hypothetical protein